jgi:pimeloyl-ACP methyl ester carboxylesterase
MTRVRLPAVVFAALLLAGCGSGHPAAAPSPVPAPAADCVSDAEQRSGGVTLPSADAGGWGGGVVLGTGTTGVVLANESVGDLCQWKPFADSLATSGYRALVFNYSMGNSGQYVLNAIGELRKRGVQRVFLVGASMGGTSVLYAAAHAQPPVAGVVSLSAPQVYGGVDAIDAVKTVTVPALFLAGRYDAGYADEAQDLYAACPAKDKRLSIVDTGAHGVEMLTAPVETMVRDFLTAH